MNRRIVNGAFAGAPSAAYLGCSDQAYGGRLLEAFLNRRCGYLAAENAESSCVLESSPSRLRLKRPSPQMLDSKWVCSNTYWSE
jgi:hypothetical protein